MIHALVVAFVIGGTIYIWIGAWRRWPGTRSPLFRYAHLGVMVFVAAQAILGRICPLTLWEDQLRGNQTQAGLVARWVRSLIYYDLPGWVFTTTYVLVAAALIITLVLLPPRRIRKLHSDITSTRRSGNG